MKNIKNQIQWILQEKYNGKLTRKAKKDIERFKKGEPLDYIIGFVEFLGCKIDLSKKPLIPRVETEFWVEKAIIKDIGNPSTRYTSSGQDLRILDMFAGSGCIGVSVMRHLKNAKVVFADSQKSCIEQIRINCKLNNTNSQRYKIIQSDVFSNVQGVFDIIFANPPYIPDYRSNHSARLRTILRNRVQKSVLNYEPKEALFGGKNGMIFIEKFLASAKNFLNPEGKIYMEFDSIQKNKIEKLLKDYKYKNWEFHKDQYGKWRWVVVK